MMITNPLLKYLYYILKCTRRIGNIMLFPSFDIMICIICLISTSFCFLTLYIFSGPSYQYIFKDSKLAISLQTAKYHDALLFSVAAALPLMLELCVDRMVTHHHKDNNSKFVKIMMTLITCTMGPNFFLLTVLIPLELFDLSECIFHAKTIVSFCIFLVFANTFGKEIWKPVNTVPIAFFYSISEILNSYLPYLQHQEAEFFNYIILFLHMVSTSLLLYMTYKWFRYVVPYYFDGQLTHYQYSVTVYSLGAWFAVIACWILYFICGNVKRTDSNADYLTYFSIIESAMVVMITIITCRVARRNAFKAQQALEQKKNYIRYISHEIRTPLNTVFLGLQLLRKDIQKIEIDDPSLLGTIDEIKDSCDIALQILNDLLTYDKLADGNMQLEKKSEPAWEFVNNIVRPFLIQARQGEIELSCALGIVHADNENTFTCGTSNSNSHPKELALQYMLHIDKHKLSQVIRNIVSNALKFTPRGGTVKIVISFLLKDSLTAASAASHHHRPTSQQPQHSSLSSIHNNSIHNPLPALPSSKLHPLPKTGGSAGTTSTTPTTPTASTVTWQRGSVRSVPSTVEPVSPDMICRIEVTDTGPGLTQENQAKLFSQIIQFSPGELQGGGGSGLGLFISKSIVDLHNGKISVYSEGVGCGSTFTLDLPVTFAATSCNGNSNSTNGSSNSNSNNSLPVIHHSIAGGGSDHLGSKVHFLRNNNGDSGVALSTLFADNTTDNDVARGGLSNTENIKTSSKNKSNAIISSKKATAITTTVTTTTTTRKASIPNIVEVLEDYNSESDDEEKETTSVCLRTQSQSQSQHTNNSKNTLEGRGDGKGSLTRQHSKSKSISAAAWVSKYSYSSIPERYIRSNSSRGSSYHIEEGEEPPAPAPPPPSANTSLIVPIPGPSGKATGSSATSSPLKTMQRALVVDDAVLNRKMLCRVLKGSFEELLEAEDGSQAVSIMEKLLAKNITVDAILMDYMMPLMNGPTAAREIRTLGYRGVIIGVTGNALPSDIKTFMSHGADKVLTKPLGIDDFESAMRECYVQNLLRQHSGYHFSALNQKLKSSAKLMI